MKGETWYLPSGDGEGTLVLNAHKEGLCAGHGCPLHNPSNHWAKDMPLTWKHTEEGGYMTRICPHGAGHDDPDDADYRRNKLLSPILRQVILNKCDCPCECEHRPPF